MLPSIISGLGESVNTELFVAHSLQIKCRGIEQSSVNVLDDGTVIDFRSHLRRHVAKLGRDTFGVDGGHGEPKIHVGQAQQGHIC